MTNKGKAVTSKAKTNQTGNRAVKQSAGVSTDKSKKTNASGKSSARKTKASSGARTQPVKSQPAKKQSAKKKNSDGSGKKNRFRFLPIMLKLFAVVFLVGSGWLIYLDATLRDRFEGNKWQIPAKVYARPLEIYSGVALNAELLEWELQQLGYRESSRLNKPGSYFRQGRTFRLYTRGFAFPDGQEHAQKASFEITRDVLSNLQAGTGDDLIRLEPLQIGGIYPNQQEERILLQLDAVPDAVIKTLLAVEDKKFWSHHGIAPTAILRALWVNTQSGRVVQGASTLTQQLVKNFFLSHERTLTREATEAAMAVLLDFHYSKEEILEAYLNEIYLGQSGNRAIHGFGSASQFYFAQSLEYLELHQISLLVALVKGPSYYNPRKHPDRALARRNLVLDIMVREQIISATQADAAKAKPLGVTSKPVYTENRYPAFLDLVKRQLQKEYQQEDLESEGLKIFTTMNPQVQHQSETRLASVLSQLEKRKQNQSLEGAVVITGAESGELIALVGGRDARFAGFNRAIDAKRPIGSLAKPAVYLTALERSDQYTLSTLLEDKQITVPLPNGNVWEPKNYDGQEHGIVPLHMAMAHSLNLSTVHLGMSLGVNSVVETFAKLGVKEQIDPFYSLFLGALSLSPYQVATMYQTISASGFNVPVRAIREVVDAEGGPLSRYEYELQAQFKPQTVYLLHRMMQEVMQEGTGRSAYQRLSPKLNLAGKTGTTNDSRDSWFAGMTGDYLGVVWVGRDDNQRTALTGATGALRIWSEIMRGMPQRSFNPVLPEGVDHYWIMEESEKVTDSGCEGARELPFIVGTQPVEYQNCQSGFGQIKGWIKNLFD
ncbi:MAG: penicillin-binding protein 1B [Pseudomonadales bacterium]|nr:penicillin-binding protein 1B [Pseudomonadales bacterium]